MANKPMIDVKMSMEDFFNFHIESGDVLLSEEKYRMTGKTTALVRLAIKHHLPLVVRTQHEQGNVIRIAGEASKLKCYTIDEILRSMGEGLSFPRGFLVDDIKYDAVLKVAELTRSRVRTGCVSLDGFLNT